MKNDRLMTSNQGWKIGIVIVIVFVIIISFLIYTNYNLKDENILYKIILKANNDFSEVSLDSQKGDMYRNLASLDYEDSDYSGVENNCLIAREYYVDESQGYKDIKAELKSLEIEDKLIDIYLSILDSSIEISNNDFESCEYFESAARYYDKYYNGLTSSKSNHDMGGLNIESMNEKIKARDNAVEKYNNYLADFGIELEKRYLNDI